MELNRKQEEGLKLAVARYKHHEKYTCISGYAGAGKSTLIKFIVAALNLNPDDVAYITFTGKAAENLRKKGCPNAMTAHKLLMYNRKTSDGKLISTPRKVLEKKFKLIIVDEVSMLPKNLWDLLLTHKVHIIACGDPGQLPPISQNADNHVLDMPDIFLDEVMRQAQDSAIIRTSMAIRNGEPIPYGQDGDIWVKKPFEVIDGMYTWADQILVATNNKRKQINNHIRQNIFNRGNAPEKGDKLISLANHWNCLDYNENMSLVNGTIGYLGDFYEDDIHYPKVYCREGFPYRVHVIQGVFQSETGEDFGYLTIDHKALLAGEKTLTPAQEAAIYNNKELRGSEPKEFNYGYAITCHKAQGSQWDKVLVFEENFPFDKEEHKRWLYTAVTRAESKLVLVR